MSPKFRMPDETHVREAAGRHPRETDGSPSLASRVMSTLGGTLFIALIVIVWAADLVSCFGGILDRGPAEGSEAVAALRPRALREDDAFERLVSTEIVNAWSDIGRSGTELDVWIIESDEINAASLGAGRFVIWRGLQRLPADARAAIYAHEFAHDQLRHSQKAGDLADVAAWAGEVLSTVGRSSPQASATLHHWTSQMVLPHYSRTQEREADREAVRLLGTMGYKEPEVVMCRALERIRVEVGESGGGLFASHPSMSERISSIASDGC